MTYDDILGSFSIDHVSNDLGPYLFLRGHTHRGDRHLLRRDLPRAVPRQVLPDRARLVRSVDADDTYDVIVEVDDVLVLLRSWSSAADVWASAPDDAAARRVVAEIEARMPPPAADHSVEVSFTDAQTGTRVLPVAVRTWSAIRANYAPGAAVALDAVMAHRPSEQEARRLLLWHGAPGTGKTTAVRALLDAWRDWADGTVVTDPEALLSDGRYLRRAVIDNQEDGRWQLLVLEDAESLLHKGAGATGMAKLLNLADGLLGQGLRCLFLVTTNEPLGAVHPALVRPGRCLARIEFTALAPTQAAGLLSRPVERAMTLADVMAAGPVSVVAPAPFGFGEYA